VRPAQAPLLLGAALGEETAAWAGGWADGLAIAASAGDAAARLVRAFREGGGGGKPVFGQLAVAYAATEEAAVAEAYDQWRHVVVEPARLAEIALPEEFQQIVVRTRPDGSVLRLGDVARVELGAQSYGTFSRIDRNPSTGIGVYSLPTANALDVAAAVHEEMAKLGPRLPAGVEYRIVYEPTRFVTESIREVLSTLFEAMLLVFLVVYVFLQSFRATLIPAITVPVSLVGTFALMLVLGFSINTLTLFGLVLAIGLVVDDAIVVVENVARLIEQKELGPLEATVQAMREVTAPIVAISLVLMAVFLPVAFLPGTTGELYRQFALTIAFSVAISALNALTLSPALCALLLRREHSQRAWARAFERGFAAFGRFFERAGELAVLHIGAVLAVFAGLIALTFAIYTRLPTAFLPDGASLQRTEGVTKQIVDKMLAIPGVRNMVVNGGLDFLTQTAASNGASCFAVLEPWDERTSVEESLPVILARARKELASILAWGAALPSLSLGLALPTFGLSLGLLGGYPLLFSRVHKHRVVHGDAQEDAALYAAAQVLAKFAATTGVAEFTRRWMKRELAHEHKL